jgi:hypothetical protein
MRRIGYFVVLAATLFATVNVFAGDIKIVPKNLNAFIQQRGLGPGPLTPEEWCQLAFLAMTSPQADEQSRVEINVMARNRGCYTEAHPSNEEATRAMICRSIPALLSEPGISSRQKLSVMETARANACVR